MNLSRKQLSPYLLLIHNAQNTRRQEETISTHILTTPIFIQPEAVRHRAAAITLDLPSISSRKRKLDNYYIPTPTQSSQIEMSQSKLLSSPSSQYRSRNFMASSGTEPTESRKSIRLLQSLTDSDVDDLGKAENDASSSSDHAVVKEVEDVAADDSDELPNLGKALERIRKRQRGRKTGVIESDEDVVSPPKRAHKKIKVVELSSEDDDVNNNGQASKAESEVEDDEDDTPPVSTRRRRLQRALAAEESSPIRKPKNQAREDLDEDLDFLNDSDSYAVRPSQTPQKKTAKQKALEALRRKRSRQSAKKSTRTIGNRTIVLSDSDEEEEQDAGSDEGDVDDAEIVQSIVSSTKHTEDNAELEEEDDFVVSDDADSPSSHPVDLPMQFSRYATMKPAELFKYAVEWLVQKKINPAFAMSDDVYRMAFHRLDDFVKGMGGSKFQSSIWQPKFSGELLGRPNLEEKRQSSEVIMHGCDACNRTNHPATFEVRFSGAKYDKETLEEDSDDEGEDEDSSSSSESQDADPSSSDEEVTSSRRRKKSRKSKGNNPASRTFYLGKFCMANARTLHTLTHWRYHLNEWVIDHMTSSGYLTAALIVERDGWSTKKRRKYANSVVDTMEEEGEIKKLYTDFKREVSSAQRSSEGRYGTRNMGLGD